MKFALTADDIAAVAKRHGTSCPCDVCEAYALEMRKRHSAEQDALIQQLADKHGIPVARARDWLYKGKVGRKIKPTRYRRREFVLTADDIANSTPANPIGRPAL